MSLILRCGVMLFVLVIFDCPEGTWGQEPYYKGKTITILAGTGAGNVYDLYAQLFAQHMAKYIPGNPDIIVQNMPGAASMIAANHLANVTKPDGLTLVICRAFTITAFFVREPFFTWVKTKFVRILVQSGKTRDRRLLDVPTVFELVDKYKTDDAGPRLANLVLAGGEFGRPYVLRPNVPADKGKIIREAFAKTIQDEAAIADGKQQQLEFDPSTAESLETLAKDVVSQPDEIVARMKSLLTR